MKGFILFAFGVANMVTSNPIVQSSSLRWSQLDARADVSGKNHGDIPDLEKGEGKSSQITEVGGIRISVPGLSLKGQIVGRQDSHNMLNKGKQSPEAVTSVLHTSETQKEVLSPIVTRVRNATEVKNKQNRGRGKENRVVNLKQQAPKNKPN